MDTSNKAEQHQKLVIHYSDLLSKHELNYSELDKVLREEGIPEDELNNLKKIIDEEAQAIILSRNEERKGRTAFNQGVAVLFVGFILTIIAWFGVGLFAGVKALTVCTGLMGYGGYSILQGRKRMKVEEPPKRKMKRYFEK